MATSKVIHNTGALMIYLIEGMKVEILHPVRSVASDPVRTQAPKSGQLTLG